eukprot:TRINITY_DN47613_c0_g1_i1.p1 TRINITY_DN47613_c0_g1~~TRINITY_DN47613_c0_g1_i1.p1  ORF type:complete len:440 (+),score=119.31 TRINITY_DN47613_c0_g1_i1:73-1320(+)
MAASAQQARLLRMLRGVKPGSSDMDLRVLLEKHIRVQADQDFSRKQEAAWAPYMPAASGAKSFVRSDSCRASPIPTFPGEYRPNQSDVRSITAHNMRMLFQTFLGPAEQFRNTDDLMLRLPNVDMAKIQAVVGEYFPHMDRAEVSALLDLIIKRVQSDPEAEEGNIPHLTADMLQLQGYPQTFTAMLEAVGRRRESKLYKVVATREKFFGQLDFSWDDLLQIRANSQKMGKHFVDAAPDVIDVVHALYREYAEAKVSDDKKQVVKAGAPRVVHDQKLQYSHATGYRANAEAVCRLREAADGNGAMSVNGGIPHVHFLGRVACVEMLLQPFDECDLSVFDFDVDIEVFGGSGPNQAQAARVAISNALVKMIPHTRQFLDMASFLYPDPRTRPPRFEGEIRPGMRPPWNRRGAHRKY